MADNAVGSVASDDSSESADSDDYNPYAPGYGTPGAYSSPSPYTTSSGSTTHDNSSSTTDSEDNGGEYECATCEWATDIDNEHRTHVQHWCTQCDAMARFVRTDSSNP